MAPTCRLTISTDQRAHLPDASSAQTELQHGRFPGPSRSSRLHVGFALGHDLPRTDRTPPVAPLVAHWRWPNRGKAAAMPYRLGHSLRLSGAWCANAPTRYEAPHRQGLRLLCSARRGNRIPNSAQRSRDPLGRGEIAPSLLLINFCIRLSQSPNSTSSFPPMSGAPIPGMGVTAQNLDDLAISDAPAATLLDHAFQLRLKSC